MALINNIRNQQLSWVFKKKKSILNCDENIILNLRITKKRALFKIADKNYMIRNKGFYKPTTFIEEDENVIGQLKHFFRGSTSLLEFSTGNLYYFKCHNPIRVRLSIYSSQNNEIIRYRLISKTKASVEIINKTAEIPETELICLLVSGYYYFLGIIKENKVTNFESVIFSNTTIVK